MRDGVTVSIIAGVIAAIPMAIMDWLWCPGTLTQITLRTVVRVEPTGSMLDVFSGWVIHFIFAAAVAVPLFYLLHLTGRDNWWLKGISYSVGFTWMVVRVMAQHVSSTPTTVPVTLLVVAQHVVYGLVASYVMIRISPVGQRNSS